MKKLNLHLHTINTISDSDFEFSLEKLKEYVETLGIDAIAIYVSDSRSHYSGAYCMERKTRGRSETTEKVLNISL